MTAIWSHGTQSPSNVAAFGPLIALLESLVLRKEASLVFVVNQWVRLNSITDANSA